MLRSDYSAKCILATHRRREYAACFLRRRTCNRHLSRRSSLTSHHAASSAAAPSLLSQLAGLHKLQRQATASAAEAVDRSNTEPSSLSFAYQSRLQQLDHLVAALQTTTQTGPALLELLADLELTRSNLLRPASYFVDFPTSANQQAEAQQLQQYVITMTAPVYMDTTLLLLLLQTVQQALQELAAAAAAAAAALDLSGSSRSFIVVGQVQYVAVGPDLAVNPTGAAAAVCMAAAACTWLSHLIREQNESGIATSPELAPAAIAALQACLRAVDAALNSTIPASSSSSSSRTVPVVSSIKEGAILLGGHCVQYLMLCRQLVASWIPPLVAEAAAGNNNNAVSNTVTAVKDSVRAVSDTFIGESDKVTVVSDRLSDSRSQALDNAQIFKADRSEYRGGKGCNDGHQTQQDTGNEKSAPAAAQHVDGSSCCQDPATATVQSNTEAHPQSAKPLQRRTIRQLLQSALTTLSAVSSSSSSSDSSVIAPLILMTADQAAVLQPLLRDAGLDESSRHQQQQQQGQGAVLRSGGGTEISSSSGSSSSSVFFKSPWIPLIATSGSMPTSTTVAQESRSATTSAQQQQQQYPVIVQGSDGGDLILQTSATLTVHDGPGGQVLLTDFVSVTDHAQQVILSWQQQQQQQGPLQQQQQQQGHEGDLIISAGLPLCLLRVSSDVEQLLLRCHPNPGVRQLLHQCGLLPLLSIQEQVLGVVLDLRQRLASQHAVPDYTHLVLSGSCIGTAAAAAGLLKQLEPVLREYACTEHDELAAAAARAARAAGRWGGSSSSSVDPWNLAYIKTDLDRRSSDLDWGRDIAPYFTLPGLFDRIDALLNATCGLRLLPAAAAATAAAVGQHGRSSSSSCDASAAEADHCGIHLWGPLVMHFVLVDSTFQPQQQQQQQQQQYGGLILGNIFIELVQGWGFPFCSLLQLPQTTASNHGAHHKYNNGASQTDVETSETLAAAALCGLLPASVVVRLPLPTAKPLTGFGRHQQQQQQQQQECNGPDVTPIALPGPAALQALLHELGHALSYLCPYATLIQQQQHQQQQQQGGTYADQSEASSSAAAGVVGWSQQPAGQAVSTTTTTTTSTTSSSSSRSQTSTLSVFSQAIGPCGLCLLSGPSAGVDVREMSSHVFEHWARSPIAIVALSCHERLGVPLPHHTALQLPQLMMAAAGQGAGSSMKLHASVLEAEADLDMHMQQQQQQVVQGLYPQQQQQQQLEGKGRVRNGCSNTDSNKWSRVHAIRRILRDRSVPSGAETLEEVEELSALGPVGGTKAAYVMAKLLAAATWKHLGFEREPIGHSSGGSWLKEVLLCGGCYQPGHHTVMRLLGDVDVLEPVVLQMAEVGCATSDKQQDDVAADSWVSGWVPNLGYAAYQDLDLL